MQFPQMQYMCPQQFPPPQQQMYQPQQQWMQPPLNQHMQQLDMVELITLKQELAGLREAQKTNDGQDSSALARRIGELEFKIRLLMMAPH